MWNDVRDVPKMELKEEVQGRQKNQKVIPSARLSSTIGQDVRTETKLDSEWLPRLSTAWRVNLKMTKKKQKKVYYLWSQDQVRNSGRSEQEILLKNTVSLWPRHLKLSTTHWYFGYADTDICWHFYRFAGWCAWWDGGLARWYIWSYITIHWHQILFQKMSCDEGARDCGI